MTKTVDTKTASSHLGITPATVSYHIKKGNLKARKVNGKQRITRRSIEQFASTRPASVSHETPTHDGIADAIDKLQARIEILKTAQAIVKEYA